MIKRGKRVARLDQVSMVDILRAYPMYRCSYLWLVYAEVTSHEGVEGGMVEGGPLMSSIAIRANVDEIGSSGQL